LKSDAADRIDEAYEKVSKREISYEEMKAIEQWVKAELACVMQELKSGVNAGGKAAAGVHEDDMDLDATLAAKDNTPPARRQVTKRKQVEFVEKTRFHRCERCQRRNMECVVPEGERRCRGCNTVHQACSFARPRKADDVGDTRAKKTLTKSTHADSREASGSAGGGFRAGAYVGKPPSAVLGAEVSRAHAEGEEAVSGEDTEWLEAQRGLMCRDILILRDQIAAKQGALAVLEGQLARLG
jgi:hypothetical protein